MCSVNCFIRLFKKIEAKELKPRSFLVCVCVRVCVCVCVGGAFNFFAEQKNLLSGLGNKFVICPFSIRQDSRMLIGSFPVSVLRTSCCGSLGPVFGRN